ncbi:hypothetical protein J416_04161 [Gracilibacillus halophilus YIM-C55.5]|uniref:Lipase class 3 n=1 Tax=Gracilibacillus halophilus YIM-C55.5 TaxID=1308866 RepID=N4WBQ4_9BACI|nr:hypothetical protein [Gracilibacillus halophilus]ENH97728.1 hypothetical protein J416_04161 [Gracilibacillus halophilus YIM-C55.5]
MASYVNLSSDKDLVELGGYHAYSELEVGDLININEDEYRVVHSKKDNDSGLDAYTVYNIKTEKFTVIYVGTNADQTEDLVTDFDLLTDREVPQVEAAIDYYEQMDEKYKVSSVAGNSLGGALANAVGVTHTDVRSVTLNPALLPKGMMDTDEDYHNVTNYFSKYDVLTGTLTALGYDERIPGKQIDIHNGTMNGIGFGQETMATVIGSNHTGYVRRDDGGQYYQVREAGQPGAGKIRIDADEHIVTSIWTDVPLYGMRKAFRIDINPDTLDQLATGLGQRVIERLELADRYLLHAKEIVDDEHQKKPQRITTMQETWTNAVEKAADSWLFQGITGYASNLQNEIDEWISYVNRAEERCQSLNHLLNAPPVELAEFIFRKNIDVESIFRQVRQPLEDLQEEVDQLAKQFRLLLRDTLPSLLYGGIHSWEDAVVEELAAHYQVIARNQKQLFRQLETLKQQVALTGDTFYEKDLQLADGIRHQHLDFPLLDILRYDSHYTMETSPYVEEQLKIREKQLDQAYTRMTNISYAFIQPLLRSLVGIIYVIEHAIETTSATIKQSTSALFTSNIPGRLVGMFSNYDEMIRERVQQTLSPLDTLGDRVEGVRIALNRLSNHFPELLREFRPYIENAIFEGHSFHDAYLYNRAAMAILEEMDVLFDDITYQLSGEQAETIEALMVQPQKSKSI